MIEPIESRFKSSRHKLENALRRAEQNYTDNDSGTLFDEFTSEELMQKLFIEEQKKAQVVTKNDNEYDEDLVTDTAFERVRKKNNVYSGMPAMIIEEGTIIDHSGTPFESVHTGFSKEFSGLAPEKLLALDHMNDEELLTIEPFHFYAKLPEIVTKNAHHPVVNVEQALNELQSYRHMNKRVLMVGRTHATWHEKILNHTLLFHSKESRAKNRVSFIYLLHITIALHCVYKIHKPIIQGQPILYQWMGHFYARMVNKDI